MKNKGLLIVLLILLSLIPVYYVNQWLQRIIRPRRSFAQLLLYIFLAFILIFLYTFLLVMIITKLFPVQRG